MAFCLLFFQISARDRCSYLSTQWRYGLKRTEQHINIHLMHPHGLRLIVDVHPVYFYQCTGIRSKATTARTSGLSLPLHGHPVYFYHCTDIQSISTIALTSTLFLPVHGHSVYFYHCTDIQSISTSARTSSLFLPLHGHPV